MTQLHWWFFTATDPITLDLAAAAVISAEDEDRALTAAKKMGARHVHRNRVEPLPEAMLAIVPPQWTNRLLSPDDVAWTALWNDAEREGFERAYAERSGVTVDELHSFGRYAEPCSCDAAGCEGYVMGHQVEDALFENGSLPAWALA